MRLLLNVSSGLIFPLVAELYAYLCIAHHLFHFHCHCHCYCHSPWLRFWFARMCSYKPL
jgi:hypothetical protein